MKPAKSIKATRLALTMAIIVTVSLPLGYFILEYQRLSIILETEAEANALFASQIINANPDYWPFEHIRFHEFLSRRLNKTDSEIRRIIDLKGETIAQHQDEVRYPFIVRAHNLYDYGTVVGKLEIARSLRPLLWRTILVGVFGCLLIATIYLVLRKYVLSAREEAEKALRESEKRFRDIADNASEWIWEVDAQGKYIYASSAVEKLLGYQPEEVLNKHFYDLLHPEDREEFKEKALAVFAAKQPFHEFLNRNLHKNGQEVWLATSGLPVLDENGELIGYRGADTDITARRRAEQALQESEKKYRLLVNQIPAVVFRGYADWSIDTFDRKIESLTGYAKEDFDTRRVHWSDLILEDDLSAVKGKFLEALKTTGTYVREYRIRKKSGEVVWVHVQGQIFRDAAGMIDHIIGVIFDVTARKRAEEALLKYEFIANTAKDCMTLIDRNYLYEAANAAYCQAHGKTREEVVGNSVANIWGEETFEKIIKGFLDQCFSGQAVEFEGWFEFGKKGRGCYNIFYSPYFNADGSVAYAAVVSHDITERKQAEEALIASEENYRTIFNAVQDGIFIHDAQTGAILDVNQNVLEFAHCSLEEIRGLNIEDITQGEPPYTQKEALELIRKASTAEPQTFKWRGKDRSGRLYWWEINLKLVTIGNKECVLAVARNITGRLQAEEALQESERRYRLLAENVSDVIWTMNLNLEMTYVSPSAELLRGYTAQETVRQKLEEILTPASLDLALMTFAEALNFAQQENKDRNRTWSLDLEQNCKDGSTIWAEVHSRFMYDDAGRPTGILGVTRNISDRKRAEEELQQYKVHLESLVQERTGQLTRANEQLNLEIIERQRTAEKLQTSLDEKEALLREIHHRVKNNLQLISSLLNLQAIYQGEKDPREVFAESENRIRSLALIHESLYKSKDFSRIEFTGYLRELLVRLQQAYKIPGQSINCAVEGNEIYLDITQAIPCGLVVNELVSNALKHAFPGGREGEILVTMKAEGDRLVLRVKDNGVHPPPSQDLQNKKSMLGLQIVTTLVKQLDGTSNYSSNGGTEFILKFRGARQSPTRPSIPAEGRAPTFEPKS